MLSRIPRTLRPAALLATLVGLLASLLTLEGILLLQSQVDVITSREADSDQSGEGEPATSLFTLPEKGSYLRIVEAPLFMESRQPGQDPPPPGPPPAPPKKPTPLKLKLMGTIKTPQGKMVLVVDEKGKYKRMKLLDELDGWQLKGIDRDGAQFSQGDQSESLDLLKPRAKKPMSNSPVSPPPSPTHGAQGGMPPPNMNRGRQPPHQPMMNAAPPEPEEEVDPDMDAMDDEESDDSF